MKWKVEDTSTYKGVFWMNFISTIFFNIFSLCSVFSMRYTDYSKNKLQVIGTLLGLIASTLLYLTVAFIFQLDGILQIVIPIILIILNIVYIIIVKRIAHKKGL